MKKVRLQCDNFWGMRMQDFILSTVWYFISKLFCVCTPILPFFCISSTYTHFIKKDIRHAYIHRVLYNIEYRLIDTIIMEQHTNGWTYGLQNIVPFNTRIFGSTVRQSCKKDLDVTWNRLSPRMMKKTIVQMINTYVQHSKRNKCTNIQ